MWSKAKHAVMLGWVWLTAFSANVQADIDWDAINKSLNMTPGVTKVSRDVYDLHMAILWICVIIGVVVFGVMFYSMYKHRKSKGAVSAKFHESIKVEILWTIIPFFILVGMAVPATKTLIDMYDTSESDVDIQITGYQWKWQYKYLGEKAGDQEVSFFSVMNTPTDEIYNGAPKGENYLLEVDEPLVIPINKKVRFLLGAADVIHSWWIPDFAVKRDAIPGFINEASTIVEEPGIYRGQCTELCGKDHGFMPIVVRAVEEDQYLAWLEEKKEEIKNRPNVNKTYTMAELMELGEQVYTRNCAVCHQANGQGIPPTFPSLVGSPIAVGAIQEHVDIVVKGKKQMPAFAAQLSEVDIAAVVTYERNAWGNDVGDLIQPRDIKK